jgi:hypothetical protein
VGRILRAITERLPVHWFERGASERLRHDGVESVEADASGTTTIKGEFRQADAASPYPPG